MNKTNKKGFTLAELLIVVAIIAVLVAIAIPVFTSQLEKAREATDAANIRAAYAEVMVAGLNEDTANYTKDVDISQKGADWKSTIDWPKDIKASASGNVTVGGKATLTFDPTTATISLVYGTK